MSPSGPFQMLAPNKRIHHDALIDLIAKVFSQEGYFTFRDYCRLAYIDNSHYDWEASRIGLLDGQLVTHYGVWGYDMRIGSAQVRTGGIGAVATHSDYRKHGFMAHTIQASLQAMRVLGYDISILFGIDNFYHKFGYTRGWPERNYQVGVANLPAEPPLRRAQKFTPRRHAELETLYNREYAEFTGNAVRPTYRNYGFFCHRNLLGYRWNAEDGSPAGYVLYFHQGTRLNCIEAIGDPEQILRVLALAGKHLGCTELEFRTFPYQSGVARRLRQGICREIAEYRRNGGCMLCVINLPATLHKLREEFSRRLLASPFAAWCGELLIGGEQEQTLLAIDHGQVSVLPLDAPAHASHAIHGGSAIARLLVGAEAPEAIVEEAGIELSGDAGRLLGTLFPNQYPNLSFFDRY